MYIIRILYRLFLATERILCISEYEEIIRLQKKYIYISHCWWHGECYAQVAYEKGPGVEYTPKRGPVNPKLSWRY